VFKSLRIPIDTSYCKFTEPPKIFSTLVARDLTNGIIRTSGLNAHSKVTKDGFEVIIGGLGSTFTRTGYARFQRKGNFAKLSWCGVGKRQKSRNRVGRMCCGRSPITSTYVSRKLGKDIFGNRASNDVDSFRAKVNTARCGFPPAARSTVSFFTSLHGPHARRTLVNSQSQRQSKTRTTTKLLSTPLTCTPLPWTLLCTRKLSKDGLFNGVLM